MSSKPLVSVVVSTRNRRERLEALLRSLEGQTLASSEFEVVVVDDASTDDTSLVLERWRSASRLRIVVCSRPVSGGPAAGRNVGWRAASSSLIAFTDDDCEATPQWLEQITATSAKHPDALVQGPTSPIAHELERDGLYSRTLRIDSLGPYFETCNVAYQRATLDAVGGFDEATYHEPGGEDTDLAWRVMELGAQPVFAEGALVHHAVNELGPIGMLRVALRWSDTMAVMARHPGLRQYLHRGIFWKASHKWLLLAVVGMIFARRFPPALVLAYPWASRARRRALRRRGGTVDIPFLFVHDLVETFATVRGAVRHRTLVL